MGAVAITLMTQGVAENGKRVVEGVATFSNSYATGGDTVALTTLGLSQVDQIVIPSHRLSGAAVSDAQAQIGSSIQLGGTVQAPKLKLYTSAGTEASNASDNSTVATVVRFIGS